MRFEHVVLKISVFESRWFSGLLDPMNAWRPGLAGDAFPSEEVHCLAIEHFGTTGSEGALNAPSGAFYAMSCARQSRQPQGRAREAGRQAAGAHLLFLPPYSPDLNPVGMPFAKLETLFRKADRRTIEDAWREVGPLLDHFRPDECAAYLRHAGYSPITA